MIGRAVIVWLALMILAITNGALRTALLVPYFDERVAYVISTLILCALIVLVARLTIRWIGPPTVRAAWQVGLLWLVLVLGFEFLAGHYLFGQSWQRLFEDYNLAHGRIWVLVLVTCLMAPPFVARSSGDPR
jgi:hypothetical protein